MLFLKDDDVVYDENDADKEVSNTKDSKTKDTNKRKAKKDN